MVSVSPSSTLMQMASALVSMSHVLAVQALQAHSHALAAASLLVSLVQCRMMEAMNSNVSPGVLLPGRKNGHHNCGIGKSLCRVIVLPLVLAGTGVVAQHVMCCSDAGTPEKLVNRI